MTEVPTTTVAEVSGEGLLVDVREPNEWAAGHAPEALHIPMAEVPDRLAELSIDGPVQVICRSGNRSGRVTAWLVQNGVDAYNVAGGMQAWAETSRPMVSEDGSDPHVL